jgi:N-acetylmuramoyl-L-alanine amidase
MTPVFGYVHQLARILGVLAFLLPGISLGLWVASPELSAQPTISVRVQTPQGTLDPPLSIVDQRGFAAVPAAELERLGWAVTDSGHGILARWEGGPPMVEVLPDTPFLSWGGDGVQLAEAPYVADGRLYLPLQFFVDILPWKLPEVFRYDPDTRVLQLRRAGGANRYIQTKKVVVIDPGHGGPDPGAIGPGGTREKDVALAIGKALARNLRDDAELEVYLTRDADTLIPIWKRGEMATEWRGERPGVFISIHANALPNSRATRGFETYFLSEARTDHERRVAALENAAQQFETQDDGPPADSDLSFILTELRNLDHQHWSALLAELTQERLAPFHPGPNRGVKQGPLAVITNALMPAVLVEVGFISNPEEEEVLTEGTFQVDTANAIASAVREFFRRYSGEAPPTEASPGES